MNFRSIEHGSEDFQQELRLRDRVLRYPLGRSIHQDDLSREPLQLHFGLFDEETLIACLIAVPVSPGVFQFRQMAVDPDRQGKGLGKKLVQLVEQTVSQTSDVEIFLHARLTAAAFYEKLGYVRTGPEFIEIGLPHVLMRKHLNKGSRA